ncbi:BRD4-interacting chromatin-remodeling complex-associated protein-like isoform X2 [Engraulis encrasicolus]
MDDEDDRRLLDIIGDVQALNDYLHGPNSKSIEEEDVTNAAYGNSGSFFTSGTGGSGAGIKDTITTTTNHLGAGGFSDGGESGGLQLSNSLAFIEDELGGGAPGAGGDADASPGDVDLGGGEDAPFDILQKSLLEADITEHTLAQEALLESQPPPAAASGVPATAATTAFAPQLVSGGFGGTGGGVAAAGSGLVAAAPQPQAFIQQVPQLNMPNGPAGHIQVLGSFNGNAGPMMAINSLIRPTGGAVTNANSPGQQQVFAPMPAGQVSGMPFKGCGTHIPVQNIIIQRGGLTAAGQPQALIRPIQPKPLQPGGGQTVYNIGNLGLQANVNATAGANAAYAATGSPQAAQQVKVVGQPGSIVVHSSLGQQGQHQQPQQQTQQANQFLLPNTLSLAPGSSVQGFQAVNGQLVDHQQQQQQQAGVVPSSSSIATTYAILPTHSGAVQLIAGGQSLSAGGATTGQLIVNQGVMATGMATATPTGSAAVGQMSPTMVAQVRQGGVGVAPKVWTTVSSAQSSPSPVGQVQVTPQTQTRLTLVSSSGQGGPPQARPQGAAQRLLVPVQQNAAGGTGGGVQELHFEMQAVPSGQDSGQKSQPQLVNLLGTKGGKIVTSIKQETPCLTGTQVNPQKRPAPQQLTRGGMVLQQLRDDHAGVSSSDPVPFSSVDDALHRLLPFHVFQGALPSQEEFDKVDEEFEAVASQVLKRTEAMVNKYRRLLMVEAERPSPSSEMVMIDRTFNQEERSNLTQDRRTVLVDPDGYLEDFCCTPRRPAPSATTHMDPYSPAGSPTALSPSGSYYGSHRGRGRGGKGGGEGGRGGGGGVHMEGLSHHTADSGYRTEYQPGFEDPGGGLVNQGHTGAAKNILELKKNQRCSNNNVISISTGYHQHQHQQSHPPHAHQHLHPHHPHYQVSSQASTLGPGQHSSAQLQVSDLGQSHGQVPPSEHSHQPLLESDSVLEAAVNSILEC